MRNKIIFRLFFIFSLFFSFLTPCLVLAADYCIWEVPFSAPNVGANECNQKGENIWMRDSTENGCKGKNKTSGKICCCQVADRPNECKINPKNCKNGTTCVDGYCEGGTTNTKELKETATTQPTNPILFKPQVGIPGSNFKSEGSFSMTEGSTSYIGQYISAFYKYAQRIVGIVAVIVLMIGGIIWLTSGGNPSKIGQAKDLMTGSIVGMTLLLGSWILLNTVNPDLIKFKVQTVKSIKEQPLSITPGVGSPCITEGTGGANGRIDEDGICRPLTAGDACTTTDGKKRPGFVNAQGFCSPCALYGGDNTSKQFQAYNGSNSTCSMDYACPDSSLNENLNPNYLCGNGGGGKCSGGSCVKSQLNACTTENENNSCITSNNKNGYCSGGVCQPCVAYGAPCSSNISCPSDTQEDVPTFKNSLGYKCGNSVPQKHTDCEDGAYDKDPVNISVCDCEEEFCTQECINNVKALGGDTSECGKN